MTSPPPHPHRKLKVELGLRKIDLSIVGRHKLPQHRRMVGPGRAFPDDFAGADFKDDLTHG